MISKEQWEKIEKKLTSLFANVKFKVGKYVITINRERFGESKTYLMVYIDDHFKGEWTPENMPIIKDVWRKRTRAKMKPKSQKDMIKIFGKKGALKRYPDMYEKRIYYFPYFPKASVLVRQFKKIKDIELVRVNNE